MNTKVLVDSLTQRIMRISMLQGDLKAIWSTHIIAQMGKLRPMDDACHSNMASWQGQNKDTDVLVSEKCCLLLDRDDG